MKPIAESAIIRFDEVQSFQSVLICTIVCVFVSAHHYPGQVRFHPAFVDTFLSNARAHVHIAKACRATGEHFKDRHVHSVDKIFVAHPVFGGPHDLKPFLKGEIAAHPFQKIHRGVSVAVDQTGDQHVVAHVFAV